MRARCGTCTTTWVHAERRSHCTACHRTFSSHTVGDAHRVGGVCLSDEDMAERGWVQRVRDGWTDWGGPSMPDDIKAKWKAIT